jgi:hypothetical protein
MIFVTPALAVTIENPLSQFKDLPSVINAASGLVLPFATLAALVSLIYAGFLRLSAAGDVEKEKLSFQIIEATIVGYGIIVLAPVVVSIFNAFFGARQIIT